MVDAGGERCGPYRELEDVDTDSEEMQTAAAAASRQVARRCELVALLRAF